MIRAVQLTGEQKTLLKAAIYKQIQSLTRILREEEDIELYSLRTGVDKSEIMKNTLKAKVEYIVVYKEPSKLFTTDVNKLSIIKHILFNYLSDRPSFSSLWLKICVFDNLNINLN